MATSTIKQSVAKTSFSFDLPDGYVWNFFKGYRIANDYVYMSGRMDLTSASTAKVINLGTIIPQNCRPSTNVVFAAFNNSSDRVIDGRINTDGKLIFYRQETEDLNAIVFSVMYAL